jgi:hypothetical protein
MEMAAMGERLKGRMMLRNTFHSEAPSTRAASINSSGMLIMFCRRKKMPELMMISGKIRPWYELIQPNFHVRRYSGTM